MWIDRSQIDTLMSSNQFSGVSWQIKSTGRIDKKQVHTFSQKKTKPIH